jgi:hypothetical protein
MFGGVDFPAPSPRDCARPYRVWLDGNRRRRTERPFASLDIDGITSDHVQAKAPLWLFRVYARSPRQSRTVISCRGRMYPSWPRLAIVLSFLPIMCRCEVEVAS